MDIVIQYGSEEWQKHSVAGTLATGSLKVKLLWLGLHKNIRIFSYYISAKSNRKFEWWLYNQVCFLHAHYVSLNSDNFLYLQQMAQALPSDLVSPVVLQIQAIHPVPCHL